MNSSQEQYSLSILHFDFIAWEIRKLDFNLTAIQNGILGDLKNLICQIDNFEICQYQTFTFFLPQLTEFSIDWKWVKMLAEAPCLAEDESVKSEYLLKNE